MKFSQFSASCAVLSLCLAGCVDHTAGSTKPVAQKPQTSPSQTQRTPQDNIISTSPLTVVKTPAPQPQTKARVAILLPLSGKNADIGQAMLNAAQQAVFDSAGANFELQPHDTAAQGGAAEAARLAVADGAQLIIGPLFASDVPPVAALANSKNIQILPLSTDTSLAEPGVYVMGLAPQAQVERITSYAFAHGARHFAALVPATPYGAVVGQAFSAAVEHVGGVMVDFETIDLASNDSALRVKAVASQHAAIDAVFIPEAGGDLKTVSDQLVGAGFDGVHTHLLGTGLWDGQSVGKISPLLPGAWFAAPDPTLRKNFSSAYAAAYGQEPPRLATLAYDATALAAVLSKQGGHFDVTSLTNPNGFSGLDGIFRLTPSGAVERGLAVSEVTADGARVVDAAPASFVGKK